MQEQEQVRTFRGYSFSVFNDDQETINEVIRRIQSFADPTKIPDHGFDGIIGLTQMTIPNSVTSIGYSAFNGCRSLASITIPNNVTSIGSSAFGDCSSLTQITIPSSVISIGSSAFYRCSSLTQITIPSSVTNIGDCFGKCSSLTQITIPSSVTNIGDCFGKCSSLTEITFFDPSKVDNISKYAFDGCENLQKVIVPKAILNEIGYKTICNKLRLKFKIKILALEDSLETEGNLGTEVPPQEPQDTCCIIC